jgi:hypothetical protein
VVVTPRELAEYQALRDTIRERGTVRVWIVLGGFIAWGGLLVPTFALAPWPLSTLLPLLLLAVSFEIVFTLHTTVERIGRYLQVFYEDEEPARNWEHQSMAYGKHFPSSSPDPLFGLFFCMAVLINFVPVLLVDALPIVSGVVGAFHLILEVRLLLARRQAGRQRAVDLERFRELKRQATPDLKVGPTSG